MSRAGLRRLPARVLCSRLLNCRPTKRGPQRAGAHRRFVLQVHAAARHCWGGRGMQGQQVRPDCARWRRRTRMRGACNKERRSGGARLPPARPQRPSGPALAHSRQRAPRGPGRGAAHPPWQKKPACACSPGGSGSPNMVPKGSDDMSNGSQSYIAPLSHGTPRPSPSGGSMPAARPARRTPCARHARRRGPPAAPRAGSRRRAAAAHRRAAAAGQGGARLLRGGGAAGARAASARGPWKGRCRRLAADSLRVGTALVAKLSAAGSCCAARPAILRPRAA